MNSQRITRLNEILKREIAETLFRIMHENRFDLSAVTVTRVIVSPDLRAARVLVSIRDHLQERNAMLGLLARHRAEIQERINRDLKLKYTPRLAFELDESIEKGDRILGILAELNPDAHANEGEGT